MTRLVTVGFESDDVAGSTMEGSYSATIAATANGRNGGRALRMDMSVSTSTIGGQIRIPQTLSDPGCFWRSYVFIDPGMSVDINLFQPDTLTTNLFFPAIRWNNQNQHIELWSPMTDPQLVNFYTNTARVVDTGLTLPTNQWNYVAVGSYLATSATEVWWRIIINDQDRSGTYLVYRVPTAAEISPTFLRLAQPIVVNPSAFNVWYDDIAINDRLGETGSSKAFSMVPPGAVRHMWPTSDNTRGNFTGGAGGTTNLFDAADNRPPAGVANASATNTSQFKSTGSTNSTYIANLPTFSTLSTLGSTIAHAELVAAGAGQGGTATTGLIASLNGGGTTIAEVDANWQVSATNPGTYPANWARQTTGDNVTAITTSGNVAANTVSVRKNNTSANDSHCCYLALVVDIQGTPIASSNTTIVGTGASVAVVAPTTVHAPKADYKVTGTLTALGGVTVQGRHHNHHSDFFGAAIRKIVPMATFTAVPHLGVAVTTVRKVVPVATFHATYVGTTPTTAVRKIVPITTFTASWKSNVSVTSRLKVVPVFGFYSPVSLARLTVVPVATFHAKAVRSTGDTLLVQAVYSRPTSVNASGIRRRITKVGDG